MRLFLIFMLCLTPATIKAQNLASYFFGATLENARALSDSIAANAKSPFKFEKEYQHKQHDYIFTYIDSVDKTGNNRLSIIFNIYAYGANSDLNKKGKTEFDFYYTKGNFLDLWYFWKKHINPHARQDAVLDNNEDIIFIELKNGSKGRVRLYRDLGAKVWEIRTNIAP